MKSRKYRTLIVAISLLFPADVYAGQTISTKEVQGFFYADGKMEKSEPCFEITYYIEGDTITRTRVYDFKKKQVIPDNTVYQVQRQMTSDPNNPASQSNKALGGQDVVRAIGQPGMDAIETLVIAGKNVNSYKSTGDYLVISRQEIIDVG